MSLTESFDFTTATGKLILGMLAVMAEFERQLTVERNLEALAKAAADFVAFWSWEPDEDTGEVVPHLDRDHGFNKALTALRDALADYERRKASAKNAVREH